MVQEETGVAASRGGKPHAVVVAYPLQGHVIPVVHLALRLAARGFAVTFASTEAVHDQTARALGVDPVGYDVFAAARASAAAGEMDVRYELVSDGLPVGFDRSLNHDDFMGVLLHALSAHVEELLRRVVVDPAATFLVADTFFVWPATLARKFGIQYVSFWTEPALIFNLYYHVDLLTKNGHFRCNEPRKDTITYIPGVPAIEPCELMSYLQDTDTNTVVHRIIFKAFEEARGADYVLCNTVEELEPSTIAALRREKPFYAVGPIFPAGFTRSAVATSMWAESDCSHWLDAQPADSVLYISFGSYAHVTKQELHEIAGGVLASGVRFLWVMRPDIVSSDDPEPLPEGFAAAAAGRGVVVPWCCQVEVLSHRAVSGFLTHCGWNSVLESVWAGVPMLCFPLLTDQFTNQRLVAWEWRIGVPVGDRGTVIADEGFWGGRAAGHGRVRGEGLGPLRSRPGAVRRLRRRRRQPQLPRHPRRRPLLHVGVEPARHARAPAGDQDGELPGSRGGPRRRQDRAGGDRRVALPRGGRQGARLRLGGNEYGQCGEEPERKEDGTKALRRDIPIPQRCSPKLKVRQVAAGGTHSVVLTQEGHVWTWGQPWPPGDIKQISTPVRVQGLEKVRVIAVGAFHNLALPEDGIT